jgi:aspartate ammonia-lyase
MEWCVAGITANEERCQHYAESTIALNPVIGYAKAAELVKESVRVSSRLWRWRGRRR